MPMMFNKSGFSGKTRRLFILRLKQSQREACAAFRRILRCQGAAHLCGSGMSNGKPYAEVPAFSLVAAFKDMRQILRRDSLAIVADDDEDMPVFRVRGDRYARAGMHHDDITVLKTDLSELLDDVFL